MSRPVVTTCTWNFRRHAGRVIAAACSAALTTGLVIPSASADQITNLRAQAAAIAAKINALGLQEDALSESYDAAQLQITTLQAKVAQASARLASAEAATARARRVLRADAIQAYVDGGTNPLQYASNVVQSAQNSLLRAEYVNTLAADQNNAIDQYRLAAVQQRAAQTTLKQQQAAAEAQLQQVDAARAAVQGTAAQLTALENQVNGQLATAVAQARAAQAAAAARAAQQRLAAQAAAQAAARAAAQAAAQAASHNTFSGIAGGASGSPAGGSPTVVSYTPPPQSSAAAGAVAAAESRLGDWYQWGATGPNTFDCSGLVMWAYAQVGISLPHYSGAQYADTTHIPMSDLQPGDLVFFANPGEHVAMYVGNGEVIEAPHTGAQVHIVPMYSQFVLASRVQ